ncbi:Hypothetical protein, putative [Bodo saltans]|uniref:Uncharacterized protein n=1 Tax=Bodo saltans TaxID=75058 RepID=A0A0S4KEJ5_BODSA|nr:Hypothetical protein, putative [Bodo saltans]|eukprot:CUI14107.1 Hypothetical protein, putative [Bodo saltans]
MSSDETFSIMDDSNDDVALTLASSSTFTLGSTFTLASAGASPAPSGVRGSMRRSLGSHQQLLLARQVSASLRNSTSVTGNIPVVPSSPGGGNSVMLLSVERRRKGPLTPPKLPKSAAGTGTSPNPQRELEPPQTKADAAAALPRSLRQDESSPSRERSVGLLDSNTFTLASATFSLAATTTSLNERASIVRGAHQEEERLLSLKKVNLQSNSQPTGDASTPQAQSLPNRNVQFDSSTFTIASATLMSQNPQLVSSVTSSTERSSIARDPPAHSDDGGASSSPFISDTLHSNAAAQHRGDTVASSPTNVASTLLLPPEEKSRSTSLLTFEMLAPMKLAAPSSDTAVAPATNGHDVRAESDDVQEPGLERHAPGGEHLTNETRIKIASDGPIQLRLSPPSKCSLSAPSTESNHNSGGDAIDVTAEGTEQCASADQPLAANDLQLTDIGVGRKHTKTFGHHLSTSPIAVLEEEKSPMTTTTGSTPLSSPTATDVLLRKHSSIVMTRLPSVASAHDGVAKDRLGSSGLQACHSVVPPLPPHSEGSAEPTEMVLSGFVDEPREAALQIRRTSSSLQGGMITGPATPATTVVPPSVLVTASSFRPNLPIVPMPSPREDSSDSGGAGGHHFTTATNQNNSMSAPGTSTSEKSMPVEKPATQAFLDAVSKISQRSPTGSQSDGAGAFLTHSPMTMSSRKRSVVFEEQDNVSADMPSAMHSFEIPMAESQEPSPDSTPIPGSSRTPSTDKGGEEASSTNPSPTEPVLLPKKKSAPPIRLPSYSSLGGARSQRGDDTRLDSPSMVALSLSYESADAAAAKAALHRASLSTDTNMTSQSGEEMKVAAVGGSFYVDALQRALLPAPSLVASGKTSPQYQQLQEFLSPKQRHQHFQYGDVDPLSSGTHASSTFLGASRPGLVLAGSVFGNPNVESYHVHSGSQSLVGDPRQLLDSHLLMDAFEDNNIASPTRAAAPPRVELQQHDSAAAYAVSDDGGMVQFAEVPLERCDAAPTLVESVTERGATVAVPEHHTLRLSVEEKQATTSLPQVEDDPNMATSISEAESADSSSSSMLAPLPPQPIDVSPLTNDESATRALLEDEELTCRSAILWTWEGEALIVKESDDMKLKLRRHQHELDRVAAGDAETTTRSSIDSEWLQFWCDTLWPSEVLSRVLIGYRSMSTALTAVTSACKELKIMLLDEGREWERLRHTITSDRVFTELEQLDVSITEDHERRLLQRVEALERERFTWLRGLVAAEISERHARYTEVDSLLLYAYTSKQESALRRHILGEYIMGCEKLHRVALVRDEHRVVSRCLVDCRSVDRQRAVLAAEERLERTAVHHRYIATILTTPLETEDRRVLCDSSLQWMAQLYHNATPRLTLLDQQERSRRILQFEASAAWIVMTETYQRAQLLLRRQWLHGAISKGLAVYIHYLYVVVPRWEALRPAISMKVPSNGGECCRHDGDLARQAREWGTVFTDEWGATSVTRDTQQHRKGRVVYLRHAEASAGASSHCGHRSSSLLLLSVKRTSLLTRKIWESHICRTRRRQPQAITSRAARRSLHNISKAHQWILPLPLKRIRTITTAMKLSKWVHHRTQWFPPMSQRSTNAALSRVSLNSGPTLFVRSTTHSLWISNIQRRAMARRDLLAASRGASDMVRESAMLSHAQQLRTAPADGAMVARNRSPSPTFPDDDSTSPSLRIGSFSSESHVSPSSFVAPPSRLAVVTGQWHKKPILCVQTFSRAILSMTLVAVLQQRKLSKYAATLRSMVRQYDYLSGYASDLQRAVEVMVVRSSHKPVINPKITTVTAGNYVNTAPREDSRRRSALLNLQQRTSHVTLGEPSAHADVDKLYETSVYYRKDEYLNPSTRRPFSAGKVRPQPMGVREYVDDSATGYSLTPASSRPQSASKLRPSSAQSRPNSAQWRWADPEAPVGKHHALLSTMVTQSRAPLVASEKQEFALRMEAVDAAVDHWATRRKESATGRALHLRR